MLLLALQKAVLGPHCFLFLPSEMPCYKVGERGGERGERGVGSFQWILTARQA